MISLDEALTLSREIVKLLAPYCQRIDYAGEARLERETVREIKIICSPNFDQVPHQMSFLSEVPTKTSSVRSARFIQICKTELNVESSGREARLKGHYKGLPLTIITADLYAYAFQYILETGPTSFAELLTRNLKREGYYFHSNWIWEKKSNRKMKELTEEAVFKLARMKNYSIAERVHYHDFPSSVNIKKSMYGY